MVNRLTILLHNYGKYTRPENHKRPGAEAGARRTEQESGTITEHS